MTLIVNGNLLSLVRIGEVTLDEYLSALRADVDACMAELGIGGTDGIG